ncbi:RpnC/YadD family protein [Pedobacter hiemivivus]|uniref:hypothetical protein n=1 Tax=Pedobacter hiemivivus TaxID=2530454 RepID=UPI001CEC03DE|nr:hypothetical protein [Pedobacter hiemivivus]
MQENLTQITAQPQDSPRKRIRRKDDLLWKGILEDVFEDFLCFMHPDANKIFDFNKGFEFLDKELEQVSPLGEDLFSSKVVDKLVKLYTIDGKEEWILLHVEVQGKYQKNFSERMYTYNYRIWDKHHKPITAYAIFTDPFKVERSNRYERKFLGTRLLYEFNTYKISNQNDEQLLSSNNPFALVVLIAKAAFKISRIVNKGERDRSLLTIKQVILKALHNKGFKNDKIKHVMNFLRHYVRFETEEFNNIFEQEVEQITGRTETMGIEELLLDRATKQGVEQGITQGRIEVARELKKEGLSVDFIAKTTKIAVKKIKTL